ncbi:MAG: AAA family ATPase, partial [Spirochaetales bacterium]|nr:AAA family ATPase [Spirochaetales bacterium]
MEKQMNKPLFMAFATQKGGVGKTTFTVLTASYLHYEKGLNVLVVDCDYPQYSILQMREREIETVSKDRQLKALAYEQFTRLDKKAYSILKASAESAMDILKEFLGQTKETIDLVLFDVPGTVNTSGMYKLLSEMDVFLVPISADRVVLESSLNFAKALGKMIKDSPQKQLYLFWNLVDKREKTALYDIYSKGVASLKLPLLKT